MQAPVHYSADQLTGSWILDTAHSNASFTVRNFGRPVQGTAPIAAGALTVDAGGRIEAASGTIDLGAVDTGNTRRDQDLRKPHLLDLDRSPSMSFTAAGTGAYENGWSVTGTASVRGTTAPVEFDVTVERHDSHDLILVARTVIDRRTFGIRAPRVLIGRYVTVTVRAVMTRAR